MQYIYETLCSFCLALIPPKLGETSIRPHYPNLGQLKQSAEKCLMCKSIAGMWSVERLLENYPSLKKSVYDTISLRIECNEIEEYGDGLSWALIVVTYTIPDTNYRLQHTFPVTTCDADSSSAELPIWKSSFPTVNDQVATLKSWLENCKSNHPRCQPVKGQMPKRLIEVSEKDDSPAKLVECLDIGENYQETEYATLSYCWGGTRLCTTTENKELFSKEIPIELLPPTLQDALTVARALDIKYLWIDALCIVQNDSAEWKLEAAKMRDIYAGSSLTIAATDGKDSLAGLFHTRKLENLETSRYNAADANCDVFIPENQQGESNTIVRLQRRNTQRAAEHSVLNTRGWVLQEMILSQRTVHFMASETYWHCKSCCWTETGVTHDPVIPHHNHAQHLDSTASSQIKPNGVWWKWMEDYSSRAFSYWKDRLPAMAGIVNHYATVTSDVPILGMWEKTLAQDLLWRRADGNKTAAQCPPDRYLVNVPSWSWLSCPLEIIFDPWGYVENQPGADVETHDHTTIREWDVTWTSEPLTSDVQSTRLILNGPTRELVLEASTKPLFKKHVNPPNLDVRGTALVVDELLPGKFSGQFDKEVPNSPTMLLCLLLRSRVKRDGKFRMDTFLILDREEKRSDDDVEQYRRVGLGNFSGEFSPFDLKQRRTLSLV